MICVLRHFETKHIHIIVLTMCVATESNGCPQKKFSLYRAEGKTCIMVVDEEGGDDSLGTSGPVCAEAQKGTMMARL